jgi:hypothetical protein
MVQTCVHVNAQQLWWQRDNCWGRLKPAGFIKSDEPAVEQMIVLRQQEQAIERIQALLVRADAPRLDVRSFYQVRGWNPSYGATAPIFQEMRSELSLTQACPRYNLPLRFFQMSKFIPKAEQIVFGTKIVDYPEGEFTGLG